MEAIAGFGLRARVIMLGEEIGFAVEELAHASMPRSW
jgi:hypothetical protein